MKTQCFLRSKNAGIPCSAGLDTYGSECVNRLRSLGQTPELNNHSEVITGLFLFMGPHNFVTPVGRYTPDSLNCFGNTRDSSET